ncbi:MAG: tetratricopeptide repeat protein [Acidobacteria bacterium]|nr:tetratricopeptide repeat protein [Acidobacteriota bacterium]
MSETDETIDTTAAVLKTLVLTDLVDSTKITGQLGDEQIFTVFGRHDRMARDLLAANRGREIDKTDGFLLLFDRPIDALAYAMAYHAGLRELSGALGVRLAARVGIHLGEVFLRENPPEDVARGAKPLEVEGLAKPVAARLMSLATAGQTLLTRTAFDVIRRAAVGSQALPARLNWLAHGNFALKGVEEPTEIYEVGEPDFAPLTPPPDSEKAHRIVGDQTILGWRPSPGQDVPHRPNWALVEKLGEGGYGEVWLAKHKKTHDLLVFKFCFEAERLRGIKREVTLFRLIKEALGNREDIARIRDWNFDDPPYFLEAEYTEGGSLLEWFEKQGGGGKVPLKERVLIVARVAEALAAAHSVGVLHKDIKPANILITLDKEGHAQPKLTDFGIGLLTDTSRLAEFGITVMGATEMAATKSATSGGTMQYMAPELLEGKLPTTQADIYSLGVILYQLAVGDMQRTLAPGWERQVEDPLLREDIAAAVEGVLENRLSSAGELARRLRALDERRAQREAEEKAKKAAERSRRRRKIVIPVMIGLAVLAVAMAIQARRIALEAERANREAETARQISDFMVELFTLTEADKGRGDTITAREILDRGAEKIRRELSGQPVTQARMMSTIGLVYVKLGLLGKAEPLIREALAVREKALGPDHPDTADSLDTLGVLLTRQKKYGEAEQTLRKALAVQEGLNPEGAATAGVLLHLADLLKAQGRHGDAQPYEMRAAAILKKGEPGTAAGTFFQPRKEVFALAREIDVSQNTSAILGRGPFPSSVITQEPGMLHLVDIEGRQPPKDQPLGEGEEVAAILGNAGVAVRKGSRLIGRPVFHKEAKWKEMLILDGIKPTEKVFCEPGADQLILAERNSLRLLRAEGDKFVSSAPISISGDLISAKAVPGFFAVADQASNVRAYRAADFKEILNVRIEDGGVHALAIDHMHEKLAVGGWFDAIYVYDLKGVRPVQKFSSPGKTNALHFVIDYPTLLVARKGEVLAWREGQGIIARYETQGASYTHILQGEDGILVLDDFAKKVLSFSYRSFPLTDTKKIANTEIWGGTFSTDGRFFFLGSSDGRIHRYDMPRGIIDSKVAHTQGVTSLVCAGNELISAADDKTIARWSIDRLDLLSQNKAHDYLVNYLFWEDKAKRLWSCSQDQQVKSWSLPDFKQLSVISPKRGPVASIWVDSAKGLALVGMWTQRWLEMRLRGGGWEITREQPVNAVNVYAMAYHPDLNMVCLVGTQRGDLWLYDVETGNAGRLATADEYASSCTILGKDTFLVFGKNTVVSYRMERRKEGIHYTVGYNLNTDIGIAFVCAASRDGNQAVSGSADGRIAVFSPSELVKQPTYQAMLTVVPPTGPPSETKGKPKR